ncbi:AIPR family protein [Mucilaginibacter sp. L196]|uniref:AIPR family protein n=1 Tax=Mucilaginibacter sp. L196 TaxID=1641870 RepID=UPI00131E441A|nr:AIPR family protein [Mucilaginibacter sp. L196]
MSNDFENREINNFYQALQQDIRSTQLTEEEGGTLEQIFTQWGIDLLAEAGETENARPAYDEKALGTKNQHKINGYAISENYETLDLIITIYKGFDQPEKVSKEEIDTAAKRIVNFFRKAVYKEYANDLEEASEIFQFAQTLNQSQDLKNNLVRINAIIISDGIYTGAAPTSENISGYPVYFRIIDLNYLYNIIEKSHVPIEIDFKSEGFNIPCILSPTYNEEYQSFLAIISGSALAVIYERFGARLLEQNVRSFLQFTGKINNGIRKTIISEPHMFLAFNNGIAATADDIVVEKAENGDGYVISSVKDLQIVNGGQTTASIYHTWKKDKADISGIQVQLKLSVIKKKDNLGVIVSRIAEYANTQNKVSISDLSSNKPFHIELEKISRTTVTPHNDSQPTQTKWFYERARGQYKNARLKDGFTPAKQKAFDIKNPKSQVFSKEDLAKFENSYGEKSEGKKLAIGPYIVVRGNQKNYVQFINYVKDNPDTIYFEDAVAKGILFKTAEKLYGIKPNAIGDMRYITVPYAISYLNYKTHNKLDLYKIWKAQALSENLRTILYELMVEVESIIKQYAPGSLYGEYAKKEECWTTLKKVDTLVDYSLLESDFVSKSSALRKRLSSEDADLIIINEETERIRSVPPKTWQKIEEWGSAAGLLSDQQKNYCFNLAGRIRNNTPLTEYERIAGVKIIDILITQAPEILFSDDAEEPDNKETNAVAVTPELIQKVVDWDRKNKKLKGYEYQFMAELSNGSKQLTDHNKKIAQLNINKAFKYGFLDN